LTTPPTVHCRGCGLLTVPDVPTCPSCDTLLPLVPTVVTASSGDAGVQSGQAPPKIAGVTRLFVISLLLWVAAVIADKAGAPAVHVDVVLSAVLAAIALVCVAAARVELGDLLARTGGWRGVLAALAGLAFLLAFGAVYFRVVRWIGFPLLSVSAPYLEAGWPRWAIYLSLSVAPGLFEELTFRGYVMSRLERVLTEKETLIVQAVLFSVLHLGVVIFPSHFVIGLVLGTLRRRTGSLYPGMALHMAWNAIVVWGELSGRQVP
jgi:membrane protease YdiL (CAAX protease family)